MRYATTLLLSTALMELFAGCTDSAQAPAREKPSSPELDDDMEVVTDTGVNDDTRGSLIVRGGTVVNVRKKQVESAPRDIYICDGEIVEESKGRICAAGARTVNLAGVWLIPGLVDSHVHKRGASMGNGEFYQFRKNRRAKFFEEINGLAGVTGIIDAMSDESEIFPQRDHQRRKRLHKEADIFACGGAMTVQGGHGTETAYGQKNGNGFHIIRYAEGSQPGSATEAVKALKRKDADYIKIFYDHRRKFEDARAPDNGEPIADTEKGALGMPMPRAIMEALVKVSKNEGLKTQVHIGVWRDAYDAIRAGATAISHLGPDCIPDDLAQEAAKNGVYWIPTISLYRDLIDIKNNPSLLSNSLLNYAVPKSIVNSYKVKNRSFNEKYLAWQASHINDVCSVAKLKRYGVKVLAGSDSGEAGIFPGWSVHREMQHLVEAGFKPIEALRASTLIAGEFLSRPGQEYKYGLEPGDEGTIVALSASPERDISKTMEIKMVIHHGLVVDDIGNEMRYDQPLRKR